MMLKKNVGNSEEAILTGKEELNPRNDVKREVPSGAHTIGTLSRPPLLLITFNIVTSDFAELQQKVI